MCFFPSCILPPPRTPLVSQREPHFPAWQAGHERFLSGLPLPASSRPDPERPQCPPSDVCSWAFPRGLLPACSSSSCVGESPGVSSSAEDGPDGVPPYGSLLLSLRVVSVGLIRVLLHRSHSEGYLQALLRLHPGRVGRPGAGAPAPLIFKAPQVALPSPSENTSLEGRRWHRVSNGVIAERVAFLNVWCTYIC